MVRRFFSIRIPVFGSVATLLICLVLFLVPFALRGARLGMQDMQNNVADWLPLHYPETQDLMEFRKYFYGDQFVVVSGPWCREGHPNYEMLKTLIRQESLEYEADLKAKGLEEDIIARRKGDELGLLFTGNYFETWGEHNEKWLQGRNGSWYFINRKGELYRWEGQNNVIQGISRWLERISNGKNKAKGTYIATFGPPPDQKNENPFYQNPQRLCCRPFKSVVSGPDVFEQMAGPEGTLRIRRSGEEELSAFQAKMEAHKRLTGALFGPTPHPSFNWTFDSLLQQVDDRTQAELRSDPRYRQVYDRFIQSQVNEDYEGDFNRLLSASQAAKLELWYRVWFQLELDPPPRQTCLIVTLNEPIIQELARAIGRPLMGKPRGRLPELAIGKCGIESGNFHMGGPPYDNVAIDEEGTNTLVRLAGLSFMIGMTLAYLSFGSFRVATMLFFVGGTAAISSLAFVWYGGQTMDAILMTMPSLVYVLGISASVHFVNYYRDACHEFGHRRAAEIAVAHSWFPCLLAAFTTSLGLISLTTSNLKPIYKFGLFSAIATVATIAILYAYLPSALTKWKPGYKKLTEQERRKRSGLAVAVGQFWDRVADFVIRRPVVIATLIIALMIYLGSGLANVRTTVQLLKLFDANAKILQDYEWMERNLGQLVPAEIVVCIDRNAQREPFVQDLRAAQSTQAKDSTSISDERSAASSNRDSETANGLLEHDEFELSLRLSMLERAELSSRVRQQLELFFGPEGLGVVGSGMSTDVFTPLFQIRSTDSLVKRSSFSSSMYAKKNEMVEQDYLAVVGQKRLGAPIDENLVIPENELGRELWRVSIRLAALNNVDYGRFVNDLKRVVEPILRAYEYREPILRAFFEAKNQKRENLADGERTPPTRILLIGPDPNFRAEQLAKQKVEATSISELVDQTYIFSDTLQSLLEKRGIREPRSSPREHFIWLDFARLLTLADELSPEQAEQSQEFFEPENLSRFIRRFDCVVLVQDHPSLDLELIQAESKHLIDCRDHYFEIDPVTNTPAEGMLTKRDRQKLGEKVEISAIYTGIVPIVYKAQRALLQSLIESIGLAFVMIAIVMMILLRDWNSRIRWNNLLNIRGGMICMIPNVFPVVIVFGAMGLLGIEVDIGSMMTASVAMGIAVDDTIHFMNWYRRGLAIGMTRKEAIKDAYGRVATAMTQTTLIAGLGLAAFALSTFTPTQRFGVMMLVLLSMALVGDLVLLPAILASPLGKYFGKEQPSKKSPKFDEESEAWAEDQIYGDYPKTLKLTTHANHLPEVILPDAQRRNVSGKPKKRP